MFRPGAALLSFLLLLTEAQARPIQAFLPATFTALGVGPDKQGETSFYAGVKAQRGPTEVRTGLMSISPSGKHFDIPLPRSQSEREVIALLPAGKKLLALTQWTIEQGDRPWVYSFDPRRSKWSRVGRAPCTTFEEVRLEPRRLYFGCLDPSSLRTPAVERWIPVGKLGEAGETVEVRLPQIATEIERVHATLEGRASFWKHLELVSEDPKFHMVIDARLPETSAIERKATKK